MRRLNSERKLENRNRRGAKKLVRQESRESSYQMEGRKQEVDGQRKENKPGNKS